ncbi:type III secretion system cytoplasmic ring protein SctQ [Pseudomonas sp. NPDC089530]|uniref:type III secretion system cytoplasmic ring protein SctQ n=1 Tax=Pseudomonas sp. NPDC089530 TaxID=3390651 RepID=UPI003CFF7EC9
MAAQPLQLRPMGAAEAQVRERLGAGLSLRLAAPQATTLHLRLAPAAFTQAPRSAIECACGLLWLDDAQALLSRLSACPAILGESSTVPDDCDWYWPLYNHYLAAELQSLLSPLRVVTAASAPGLDCLLELRDAAGAAGQRAVSRARIPAATLLNLLQHPDWQAPASPSTTTDWPLRLPLLLGHCPLSVAQLAALRPGDVLLAEQPLFSPEGHGYLQLGACRLHLRPLPGTALRFTLDELEDLPMNASLDHFALADSQPLNPPQAPYPDDGQVDHDPAAPAAPGRFDDLPLALTLRAGSLTLSLGQLRNLSVGSVLSFSGCAPGQATLCQGERPLAQGELVDIDGRLGLQITRLEPRP